MKNVWQDLKYALEFANNSVLFTFYKDFFKLQDPFYREKN